MTRYFRVVLIVCALFIILPLSAQPYTSVLSFPSSSGYVAVPHSSAFDFTDGYTFEAWVSITDPSGGCKSIFGNGYTTAQRVGICGTTLRSYLRGLGGTNFLLDAGTVPPNDWTHIAVTWDGTTHRHFIDGEEVAARAESGNMTNNTNEIRIGSDVAYNFTPTGSIDEVRFWNVALTKEQIRANITKTINSALPGLVAVYHLDGSAVDSVGGHNGSLTGAAAFQPLTASTCVSNATTLCFESNRFTVTAKWQTASGTGNGTVVPGATSNSGLFWFFGSDNWELLIKELNGCPVNARRWIFSAATTNVHYRLSVIDGSTGAVRRYFNYQGDSAPAVNDTGAFACP